MKLTRLFFLLLPFVVSGYCASSAAQTDAPIYSLRETHASTGSNIRVTATPDYIVPINRRYAELTANEKTLLIQQFPNWIEGDEPPYPVDGVKPLFEVLRRTREFIKQSGEFHMSVLVNEKGEPELVHIYSSPSNELIEIMQQALVLIKYKPALCGGIPCKMEFPFKLSFPQKFAM
jgi:hypothetical protein